MASNDDTGAMQLDEAALDGMAWRWLLSDQCGYRDVEHILDWSQCEHTGPLSGRDAMAVATGKRMVGNMLRAQLKKHNPEGWMAFEAWRLERQRLATLREDPTREPQ